MTDLYRKITAELLAAGYELVDKKNSGSHYKWRKPDRPPIAITHKIHDRFLANRILKIAGITKRL